MRFSQHLKIDEPLLPDIKYPFKLMEDGAEMIWSATKDAIAALFTKHDSSSDWIVK